MATSPKHALPARPADRLRRLSLGVQAAALGAAVGLFRALGPARSSNFGGWVARSIGPHLAVSRIAERNLRRAMPELDAAARKQIIRAVWDNLGRTVAELPHLAGLQRTAHGPGWEVVGTEHLPAVGTQALFVSGHFGNWEMMLPAASRYGLAVSGFYRAPSNPGVATFMLSLRLDALAPGVRMFAKGADGARAALSHLRQGGSLGMLVDQKMNDGIAVPFFGMPAMTAPALAQMALRFRLPIIPVTVRRLGPARLRMVCDPPLAVPSTGDKAADIYAILLAVNSTLERWIRADPGSWLWLHRRWPREGA